MNKPFSKELHKQYDEPAKTVVSEIANSFGHEFVSNDNELKNGFYDGKIIKSTGEIVTIEAEWKDGDYWGDRYFTKRYPFPFRWSTMDYTYRKKKNVASLFMTTNGLWAFVVSAEKVKNSKVERKFDRMTKSEESYFRVELSEGVFLQKRRDKWQYWTA